MKFFCMAAVALMMAACSQDDTTADFQNTPKSKGIAFTATVGLDADATTRALWIDDDNNRLIAKFAKNETMALVYKIGSQSYNTTAKVTDVDEETGAATIAATLEDGVVNGTELTIIYPSTAADGATGNIKSGLLAEQTGLGVNPAANVFLDVRKGTGIVSIIGDQAVMGSATKLKAQYAFCKYTLGLPAGTLQPLYIKDNATGELITTVTPNNPSEDVWVAMEPAISKAYKFELTGAYNKILKVGTATLQAGKYYRTKLPARYPLEMSKLEKGIDEGCIIAGNGKIYMNKLGVTQASETAEAMVALIGQAENNTYGLGFALENITDNVNSNGYYWSKTAEVVEAWAAKHPVEGGTWRLPSETDWQMMFSGCQINGDYVAIGSRECTINGFKQKIAAVGINEQNMPINNYYRTSKSAGWYVSFSNLFNNKNAKAEFYSDADIRAYIRACLAF